MATVLIPGSFDPIHLGHLDVVEQAVSLFGRVVVGVLVNFEKPSGLFSPDERVDLVRRSVDSAAVEVRAFGGLTIQAASEVAADFIVKGLRSAADFDIEQQMAQMNRSSAGIATVFLPCRPDLAFISSRYIREIAAHGGAIAHLVPAPVAAALGDRFPRSPAR